MTLDKKNKPRKTDFEKSLIVIAGVLNNKEYDLVANTMFSLHNGVTFGYDSTFDPRMIKDAQDIYRTHHNKKKNKNNIVLFKKEFSSK